MLVVVCYCGVFVYGVIYDFNCNELFIVSKGVGVFLNDWCICVLKCVCFGDVFVGIGFFFKEISCIDVYMK